MVMCRVFTMKYFLGFLLALIIVFLNFRILIFNPNFYESLSENNPGFNKEQSINIINYFKSSEQLKKEIYTEKEILHLNDVKTLINNIIFFLYFLIILFFLLITKYFKELNKILMISFLFVLFLSTILVILNFSSLFYNFHLIFFKNNLWLLDKEAALIKLFPEIFFKNFFSSILLRSFILSLILAVISLIPKFKHVFTKIKKIFIY